VEWRVDDVEFLEGNDDPQNGPVGGDVPELGSSSLNQLVGDVELLEGLSIPTETNSSSSRSRGRPRRAEWLRAAAEVAADRSPPSAHPYADGQGDGAHGVVFAELERDFIRMRTREALQVKKENGVTLGRPRSTPDDVVARIVRERTEGKTAYAIARDLNKDAVPSAQGAPPGRKLRSARC
jgi:hypothetical protein